MRQPDRKLLRLAALAGPSLPSAAELAALGRHVELVEAPAGAVVAPAGLGGAWRTLVLAGSVATTQPRRAYAAGSVLDHGPETALVALTDVQLATVDARLADRLDALSHLPRPAVPVARTTDKELVR